MLETLGDWFDSLVPPAPGGDPHTAEHALQQLRKTAGEATRAVVD